MMKRFVHFALWVGFLALAGGAITGCKPKPSSATGNQAVASRSSDEQQSVAPNECSYVVQSVITDLAEQIYFAAKHDLPDTNIFSVSVTEKGSSSVDKPTYELQIRLGTNISDIKCDVPVKGTIWSPQVYQSVAVQLAGAVGLEPGHAGKADTFFLDRMKSSMADDLVRADKGVSARLAKDFNNAELHEEAAAVLGVFALRDHSGKFFDLRAPLSRMTTHLTMAQLLRGSKTFDVNGQVAEAMMLTLSGNEAEAMGRLEQIAKIHTNELPLIRVLQARNTGDYRPMDNLTDTSPLEYAELFRARANSIDPTLAWQKASQRTFETADYTRIANETFYSVGTGHSLYERSVDSDLREISLAHHVYFKKNISRDDLVSALNELPDYCLKAGTDGVRVEVVGWGQWAYFEQRHLCHSIEQNFYFLASVWGVPDTAAEFAAMCEKSYGSLRLYPFVRRFTSQSEDSYHVAVDEALRRAADMPQFVPATCWNYLFYKHDAWPVYHSKIDSHLKDWFRHDPLPGTAYDLAARLIHPALTKRPDVIAVLERLHETAPCNDLLIRYLLYLKYKGKPTYDEAAKLYEAILPYNVNAMVAVANTVRDDPAKYEELMLKAADLNLNCYYILSDFEIEQGRDDAAAKYLDQACDADPDGVQVANHALWRVKYFLKKGQKENARRVADEGGVVYSEIGLEAKAFYLEETGDYDGAFEWYYKIAERYGDSEALNDFRTRYKERTGDTRFDSVANAYVKILFPNGQERVSITDFSNPPTDGTLVVGQSELSRVSGLRSGAVIVGLNGIRAHSEAQYSYIRDKILTGPQMDLIVWQNGSYQEIKASPPNHKFDVNIRDYTKRKP